MVARAALVPVDAAVVHMRSHGGLRAISARRQLLHLRIAPPRCKLSGRKGCRIDGITTPLEHALVLGTAA